MIASFQYLKGCHTGDEPKIVSEGRTQMEGLELQERGYSKMLLDSGTARMWQALSPRHLSAKDDAGLPFLRCVVIVGFLHLQAFE